MIKIYMKLLRCTMLICESSVGIAFYFIYLSSILRQVIE
jgi:hypothetical protein